ncbi:GntR family transcriptional regulator [Jiangella alba]|uniref:DNA-binding transcriptional regulator, GntR family n=1 Tax=Jiangella alba TaxID=561176 RepID=A0A1H5JFX6_9ACTN|nr:GntR family transcriptional regulator [Jiangella alba]SEE51330.1 DNA-binding transcriptional regulator, GntR family [Jiangella alba]
MAESTASTGPLIVRTKTELIRELLERDIIEGRRPPGSRIVLDEVARDLGVSKIPVREALMSLESQGLVVQTPHTGPRVAPLSLREFRAIYLLREETEALVGRLAAASIDDATIDEMRQVNDAMRAELGGDATRLGNLNTEFHLAIARASTFESLVEAVSQSLRTVRRYRAVVHSLATNWETAVAEHEGVLAALQTRDPVEVERVIRAHVGSQRDFELADNAGDEPG